MSRRVVWLGGSIRGSYASVIARFEPLVEMLLVENISRPAVLAEYLKGHKQCFAWPSEMVQGVYLHYITLSKEAAIELAKRVMEEVSSLVPLLRVGCVRPNPPCLAVWCRVRRGCVH